MTGYRGNPAVYVLCEGFAYDGIQTVIAVYATEEAAERAKREHDAIEQDAHTWHTVIRCADRTSPLD